MIATSKNGAGDITCTEGRVSITIPAKVTNERLVTKLRAACADFSGRECDPHDGWIEARSSESRRVERLLRAVLAARGINDPLGEDAAEIARLDRIARMDAATAPFRARLAAIVASWESGAYGPKNWASAEKANDALYRVECEAMAELRAKLVGDEVMYASVDVRTDSYSGKIADALGDCPNYTCSQPNEGHFYKCD